MRKLIKAELTASGKWYVELWKTPSGYSVYIAKTSKHEQKLELKEALQFYDELQSIL